MKDIRKFPLCGNPVLPAIYGETLSYAEEMGRVKQGFNDMVDNIEELEERVEEAEQTVEGFDGRMSTAEEDIDNLEQRADGVDSQIGGIQEQIGNNTLGTSVPKYNADFQDHEYEISGSLASLEDGMVGLVQKACPVPNDNDPSETDPAVIMRAKVKGWDEVKGDISTLQEKLGGNTVKTSVPQYNVQFTDHEYEVVTPTDDEYEDLEDGEFSVIQKACKVPNDVTPSTEEPAMQMVSKVKGWEKVVTDERVWGLTEVEGNPITLEVVQENEAKGAVVKFEPKQNLNGYEYPWAGGANENKAGYHTGGYVDATGAKVQNSQYGMTDVITLTEDLFLDRGTAEHVGYAIFSDAECTTMTQRMEVDSQTDSIAYHLPSGTTAYALCWWDLGSGVTASQTEMDAKHCEATIGSAASAFTPYANVCPIEGWTEVKLQGCSTNLIPTASGNSTTINGVTFAPQDDGSVICNGTASNIAIYRVATPSTWKWNGETNCWLSGCPNGGGNTTYSLRLEDHNHLNYSLQDTGDGILLQNSGVADTTIINKSLEFSIIIRSGYVCNNLVFRPMLNLGESALPYEKYKSGENITVALGQTVYGGELDVVKGECRINRALYSLTGNESFGAQSNNRFFFNRNDAKPAPVNSYTGLISDKYKAESQISHTNMCVYKSTGNNGIVFSDSRFSTVQEFTQYLQNLYTQGNPVVICYEVITPTVITGLTPNQISLLEGVNTLWTDGKSLDVLYVSDIATIKQLNDKLADTIGDIAGTEYATATSNHAVNDFIIFNGGFYKVISAITAGDTLVVGTNIRKTTVGAEITAILNANSNREVSAEEVAEKKAEADTNEGTKEE